MVWYPRGVRVKTRTNTKYTLCLPRNHVGMLPPLGHLTLSPLAAARDEGHGYDRCSIPRIADVELATPTVVSSEFALATLMSQMNVSTSWHSYVSLRSALSLLSVVSVFFVCNSGQFALIGIFLVGRFHWFVPQSLLHRIVPLGRMCR